VLRRREPLFTRAEVNGLIALLMRIDANLELLARKAEEDDAEE
jgi:hypothetical protein